jgi:hypothetical protein
MIGVKWDKHSLRVIFGAKDLGPHNAGICGGMNPDAYYSLVKGRYIWKNFSPFFKVRWKKEAINTDDIWKVIQGIFKQFHYPLQPIIQQFDHQNQFFQQTFLVDSFEMEHLISLKSYFHFFSILFSPLFSPKSMNIHFFTTLRPNSFITTLFDRPISYGQNQGRQRTFSPHFFDELQKNKISELYKQSIFQPQHDNFNQYSTSEIINQTLSINSIVLSDDPSSKKMNVIQAIRVLISLNGVIHTNYLTIGSNLKQAIRETFYLRSSNFWISIRGEAIPDNYTITGPILGIIRINYYLQGGGKLKKKKLSVSIEGEFEFEINAENSWIGAQLKGEVSRALGIPKNQFRLFTIPADEEINNNELVEECCQNTEELFLEFTKSNDRADGIYPDYDMGLIGLKIENAVGKIMKVYFAPNLQFDQAQRILELREFLIAPDDESQYRIRDGSGKDLETEWLSRTIEQVTLEKGSNFYYSYKQLGGSKGQPTNKEKIQTVIEDEWKLDARRSTKNPKGDGNGKIQHTFEIWE